jgi:hypothetical protein
MRWVIKCVLAAILFLPLTQVWACSCEWQGPFSWLTDDADAIILGKVISRKGNSFDIEIESMLKGKEFRETIRIWGQQKNDCRAEIDNFPNGSRWVFALDQIEKIPQGGFDPSTPNISYGRLNDYSLPKCGAYWLKAEGNKVSGNITSIFDWEYEGDMTPVRIDTIKKFIDGEASYADIIAQSNEVTSGDAMMRKSKKQMGIGNEWDH